MTHALFSARFAGVLAAASCAALLTACASSTPLLDANFGNAVRQARMDQTLNPNASANRDPVLGIDGKAGAAAQERYQESFRAPPQTFEVIKATAN
ncbi:MAG: hypothetical protein A3E79_06790 [Burkholderiales bacterium RIFCSPHIGHO2_12_FULL_61_11]|nr:MAG: hypothetical protein A3E79_06790 [Burkholderiales bacterium RIFCSPHIGHO2_12_FULL_61_11]